MAWSAAQPPQLKGSGFQMKQSGTSLYGVCMFVWVTSRCTGVLPTVLRCACLYKVLGQRTKGHQSHYLVATVALLRNTRLHQKCCSIVIVSRFGQKSSTKCCKCKSSELEIQLLNNFCLMTCKEAFVSMIVTSSFHFM